MSRDVAELARTTGATQLRAYLDQAQRCAERGCKLCASDAEEYRAALALIEFERVSGVALVARGWEVRLKDRS